MPVLEDINIDIALAPSRVAVVGSGLVGGSIALAARRAGHDVITYDPDEATRAAATASGLASVPSVSACVAGAGIVVIAAPVPAIPPATAAVFAHCEPGAVVTDVGSAKAHTMDAVRQLVAPGRRFVGGHPMAGKATSGFSSADETLFDGCLWMLTPISDDRDALGCVAGFARSLGAQRVAVVDPGVHDRMVAAVSHVTQLASSLLAATAGVQERHAPGTLEVAAGGFRDTTRVASSDPELWVGILQANQDAVIEVLSEFARRCSDVADAARRGDWNVVAAMMLEGQHARAIFDACQ